MQATNAEQLTALLGEVEPTVIRRILEMNPSLDEVAEALSAIEDEDANAKAHHQPSTPKVAEVRAVLEELVLDSPENEDSAESAR